MYTESELLPLSGLQHLVFCERQCALIHIERMWKENALTAEGRTLHERVDSAVDETRGDLRIIRGVPLQSRRLGLSGKADVVELYRVGAPRSGDMESTYFPSLRGHFRPVPVEYKRGQPKFLDCDRVQVCAQALCLEEMLDVRILAGELFYGKPRRRFDVKFDDGLRRRTEDAARRFHELVSSGKTPLVMREPKCRSCSLLDLCLPPPRRGRRSAASYLDKAVTEQLAEGSCEST
jgi:CRISPR-associated exonuclease Cas4